MEYRASGGLYATNRGRGNGDSTQYPHHADRYDAARFGTDDRFGAHEPAVMRTDLRGSNWQRTAAAEERYPSTAPPVRPSTSYTDSRPAFAAVRGMEWNRADRGGDARDRDPGALHDESAGGGDRLRSAVRTVVDSAAATHAAEFNTSSASPVANLAGKAAPTATVSPSPNLHSADTGTSTAATPVALPANLSTVASIVASVQPASSEPAGRSPLLNVASLTDRPALSNVPSCPVAMQTDTAAATQLPTAQPAQLKFDESGSKQALSADSGNSAAAAGAASASLGRSAPCSSASRKRRLPESETSADVSLMNVHYPFMHRGSRAAAKLQARVTAAFGRLARRVFVEIHENGGAAVLHVFPPEKGSVGAEEEEEFARMVVCEALAEDTNGNAFYVMGIVHGGAQGEPDMLHRLYELYPQTGIAREAFGQRSMTESTTVAQYLGDVATSYKHGTHRAGAMRPISMVGCVQEEKGGYMKELIDILARNPYLCAALPWGKLSQCDGIEPADSDDGPIMWTRPGEQSVLANELLEETNVERRRQRRSLTAHLAIRPRLEAPREKAILDRTGCHADHAGLPPDRHPIAAVGLLQHCCPYRSLDSAKVPHHQAASGKSSRTSDADDDGDLASAVKDVIAFDAASMEQIGELCALDYNEEPADQLIDAQFWVDDAKLNQLRRLGIKYARILLRVHDVYFIPRRVVHQFKTIQACTSITWHLRYKLYGDYAAAPAEADDATERSTSTTVTAGNDGAVAAAQRPARQKATRATGRAARQRRAM